MYYFLKSEWVDLWDVVENGQFTPTKIVNGVHVAKPKGEWSEQEKRRVALNDKAIHVLFCALSRSEYNKVCMKFSTKEIWDALVVTHEGTSQVKENKMDSLIYQYELFKLKSNETISEMYYRFVEIIGGIKSLGKTFTNEELVKKILRSLPKKWLPKVTSLKDSKDLNKVQLDELLGNLIDYEMTLKREQVEEPKKAKKTMAFKVFSEDSSDEDDEFDEEELALMMRRIRKMLFQNKKFIPNRNFKKDKGESSKRDPPICFECNKPGHIRTDSPKLKKPFKKFKKKAIKATWDESSDSEDEEIGDQVAQICFMVMEENSNEVTLNDDVVEFSYDERVNAFKVMNDELELSHKRNKLLKSELASLRKDNETSSKVCLKSSKLERKWYLDSGCSRHMTRNSNLFLSLEKKDEGGQVTFGDNGKGKIMGIGKVGKENSPILDKELLVDGLKHNLLSVSQLCDKGYRVVFESKSCFVSRMSDNKMLFISERIENIYVVDLHALSNKDVKCFVSISNDSWTWHRRLPHASMDLLANLNKDELVDGLPKIKFQKDKVCNACQMGIFLGYSTSSKAYRVFNKRTLVVKESIHVVFDEAKPFSPRKDISCDDDVVGNLDELTIEDL
ncbi:uncharacterized protein LOC131180662 [Hevea brasiliensis]|uniref:uncharacterized protein LOC131180662 n=1 Tax=Hevea brasiliensis TaxID=3981 RepID=UPI0025E710A9|nr:uncharacterized protein LOC131180662 [Hevea brasiliensis]